MSNPFELGFDKGASWARENEGVERPHPESWAEALIRELGVEAVSTFFGGARPGGPAWNDCCREYNEGCDAGVCVTRHESGPEQLGRECAKEAMELAGADREKRSVLPPDPQASDYQYLEQRLRHTPTQNEVREFVAGYRACMEQGLIVICREKDGITTWLDSGTLNRHHTIEACAANIGEDVYTIIQAQIAEGLTEGKVYGKNGIYSWSLELPRRGP
jgi:hypothetical protein